MSPRTDTRRALLQAGLETLRGLDPYRLLTAIGSREIARVAGVSSSTFFHHFPTLDSYVDALLDEVYPMDRKADLSVINAALLEYARSALPGEVGNIMFQGAVALRAADPNYRLRLGLWALGGPAIDRRYGAFMDEGSTETEGAIRAVMEAWGREIRPPLDERFVSELFNAMNGGAAIRYLTDPDALDSERYAKAAMVMTMGIARLKGERHTMADRVAALNSYPSDRNRNDRTTSRGRATRDRILDAAAGLFAEHGFEATSVAMIARNASVGEATVYEHFQSKARVAVALMEQQAGAILHAVSLDEDEPEADLQRLFEALAEFFGERADFVRPFLTAVALGDGTAQAHSPIRATTTELLNHLPICAHLSADERGEVADVAITVLISRAVGAPAHGSKHAARCAIDVVRSVTSAFSAERRDDQAAGISNT